MPPEVGMAETSSPMHSPTTRISAVAIGQPQLMAIGPPLFQPMKKLMKGPLRMEITEKEIAKLEKPDQDRLSSGL
jgi:hypothetical protein